MSVMLMSHTTFERIAAETQDLWDGYRGQDVLTIEMRREFLGQKEPFQIAPEQILAWAESLALLNDGAFAERYQADPDLPVTLSQKEVAARRSGVSGVNLYAYVKRLHCVRYNAPEINGNPDLEKLDRIVRLVEAHLVTKHPDYDKAPWGDD